MTRVETLQGRRAPIPARVVAWFSRRKYGREMDPLGVFAHAPRMLLGYSMYELASAADHRGEEKLKMLGGLKRAALINCEFCADIGSAEARRAGIGEEQLLALPR